jgi:hypothetical protein
MKKLWIGLAVLATTGALVGCGGSSETTSAVTGGPADSAGLSKIQVVHASPDAPSVNVLAGGAALIEGLDYAQSSSALPLDAGTYDLAVEAIIPGGNATVIDLPGFEVQPNVSYTAVAVGKVADGTLDTLLFANDLAKGRRGRSWCTPPRVRPPLTSTSPPPEPSLRRPIRWARSVSGKAWDRLTWRPGHTRLA